MTQTTLARYRSFTTTYPEEFLDVLEQTAHAEQVPKNSVLETAFWFWHKHRQQQAIAQSYGALSTHDKAELTELADEDLSAWEESIEV